MSDQTVGAAAIPVEFGGVPILVQAVPVRVVGSEPTSAATRVIGAYQQAEAAIMGIASSMAELVGRTAERAARPARVEIEFNVGVSLGGDAVIMSGEVEAALAVKLTYVAEPGGGGDRG